MTYQPTGGEQQTINAFTITDEMSRTGKPRRRIVAEILVYDDGTEYVQDGQRSANHEWFNPSEVRQGNDPSALLALVLARARTKEPTE
jgi:hypothetical protein